mgnify:CR=1 FL=1
MLQSHADWCDNNSDITLPWPLHNIEIMPLFIDDYNKWTHTSPLVVVWMRIYQWVDLSCNLHTLTSMWCRPCDAVAIKSLQVEKKTALLGCKSNSQSPIQENSQNPSSKRPLRHKLRLNRDFIPPRKCHNLEYTEHMPYARSFHTQIVH